MNSFYPRNIYPLLKSHLKQKQILVITGMRRTGKTTLVKQLLHELPSGNKLYLDLERLDNRELFSEKNYDVIIRGLKERGLEPGRHAFVALDEIQLAPGITSVLKYLYDNSHIKFIVTGSSSYYLKNLFTESLAGRKKVFELFPLDFSEYLTFSGVRHQNSSFLSASFNSHEYHRLRHYYEEFIQYGGFPEVVLAKNAQQKRDILFDIVSSYINIDVKSLAHFRHQKELENLMKMLAARAGTRLDYSKISRLIGLSRLTVLSYMDFLEKTYFIARIPVFSKNRDREIVKAEKIYFSDNGLMNILGDVGSGVKFENAVFTQLRSKGELRYFALKNGKEIDFILNGKYALEAKESPAQEDRKNLRKTAQNAGITKVNLVGRHDVPNFSDYIWGGDIR